MTSNTNQPEPSFTDWVFTDSGIYVTVKLPSGAKVDIPKTLIISRIMPEIELWATEPPFPKPTRARKVT